MVRFQSTAKPVLSLRLAEGYARLPICMPNQPARFYRIADFDRKFVWQFEVVAKACQPRMDLRLIIHRASMSPAVNDDMAGRVLGVAFGTSVRHARSRRPVENDPVALD